MEVEFGLTVIGEKGAEFEAALGHESEIIDSALEDFHGDAGGKRIHDAGVRAVKSDFFWPEGEEDFCANRGRGDWDAKGEPALEEAEGVGGIRADDFGVDEICFADEGGDESGGGLVIDLVNGADLLDATFIDHGHAVAHGEGFLLIVGNKDEGDAEFFLQ